MIQSKVTLDLFNFCIAFAFILLIVILRITTIFARKKNKFQYEKGTIMIVILKITTIFARKKNKFQYEKGTKF